VINGFDNRDSPSRTGTFVVSHAGQPKVSPALLADPGQIGSWRLSHLQHDWQSPVWRHSLRDIGHATVIRYDERGHGLSDRDVDDFSLEALDTAALRA